jgi:hypothetical protein
LISVSKSVLPPASLDRFLRVLRSRGHCRCTFLHQRHCSCPPTSASLPILASIIICRPLFFPDYTHPPLPLLCQHAKQVYPQNSGSCHQRSSCRPHPPKNCTAAKHYHAEREPRATLVEMRSMPLKKRIQNTSTRH